MNYSTHDTDWAESQAGNHWRRSGGVPLIVGRHKYAKYYWASVDLKYLDKAFETIEQAKTAAESELKRLEDEWLKERSYDR